MGKKEEKVAVQCRDVLILKFCLEMKFSDLESLNALFFDPRSHEMFAARKRIQKLEESGYLRSVSLLSGSAKKFYLTTAKGHQELEKMNLNSLLPKPVTKLSRLARRAEAV